jgi:hypothetical protein
MTWVAMSERKPDFGQLVVINFTENWWRLELCYYDNKQSWETREDDELGFDINESYLPGWFTMMNDKGDWWEASAISYWLPIESLPSAGEIQK